MKALLNQLTIKYKLGLLGIIMISGLVLIVAAAVYNLRTNLLEDRYVKTQHLVESATDVVGFFYQQSSSGHLSEEDAKRQALAAIKALHYEGGGYFWINDLDYKMLSHPSSKLEGQSVRHIQDPNGTQIFVDMVQTVKTHRQGFVEYQWNKPPATTPIDKVSYVKLFEPWGWIVGTGIYLDDVDDIFWENLQNLGGIVLIGFVLISWMSFAISQNIYKPLNKLSSVIQHMDSTNDLTVTLKAEGKDELGDIGRAFNSMIRHFREVLGEVSSSSTQLTTQSEELSAVTVQTTQGITQQQNNILQVSSASVEMSEATIEVAHNAQNTLTASRVASEEMGLCVEALNRNIDTIGELGRQIEQSAQKTEQLKDASSSIGDIVAVIREIADQTNLLALNAAIEAARAGEQGRGFAVVADEVRTLAARTQEATQNVESVIDKLQSGVEHTVEDMTECQRMATDSVSQAREAGDSILKMQKDIEQITSMNSAIGSAADQQSVTTQQLQETLEQIRDVSAQNADGSQHTASASDELARLAVNLNQLITRFKV